MTRILAMLLCGSALAGCSADDVRQMAERTRIQAEGIGARAEIRRADARMAAMGDGGYGSVHTVDLSPEETEEVEPEKKVAPPPQQPVYVVVPAY